ncbi:MAG: FAD:protein FMN transferase [Burkholderiaceae bacterium]|nr:FAD:protein FMN transferase [Microbacteriaceae bacterium]
MGTVASLRSAPLTSAVLTVIERSFERTERVFSLYRHDSALSRIARGELSLRSSGSEVLDAYAEALDWRARTGGNFTPHRPDGTIDLSGIVKAIAISDAGEILDANCDSWVLSVGGDVLVRGFDIGEDEPGVAAPWHCGVVDPDDRGGLLGVIALTGQRRAIATSGMAERGDHIWRTDRAEEFSQVSVIASDIVTADVLATAILSGGRDELDRAVDAWPIDVVAVTRTGELLATPHIRSEWTPVTVA